MASPPPPYDNITGISRAVMKDNAQETLANYNGSARPGELVVDLTQDPPPLYVGNNAGQLTAVSSGNNVNAVTVDVTNTNGIDTNYSITFVEDRDAAQILRADVDLRFNSATNLLTVGNVSATRLQNDANLVIRSNAAGTAKNWTFDTLNDLNLPAAGNISGSGLITGARISVTGNINADAGYITGNNIDASTRVSGAFLLLNVSPLNNLPNPSGNAGLRGFANDANLVAAGNFGAQVTDGGGNTVPVWSDGSVWRIG